MTIDVCNNVISNVVGSYNIIYTVTDPCNNYASATRIVNVVDTTQATNLQCLAVDSCLNIINSNGNKYVFNNNTTYDETLEYGLYNGTYTINNVPLEHPIAFLNNDVSNLISYTGTTQISKNEFTDLTNIYVKLNPFAGAGSYTFYSDSATQNLISNFKLKVNNTYTFIATSNFQASNHPFELDNNSSYRLTTNNSSFNYVVPNKSSIPWRCTIHSSMTSSISTVLLELGDNYIEDFYYGTITLTVSGDFGTITPYCYYHGYMGVENKFTYTTVCNPSQFYKISSDVSTSLLPSGFNGTIRLSNNEGQEPLNDFSFGEINNNINENPTKELSLYIENNEIKIKVINPQYNGNKLEILMFNLYDGLNNFVNASASLEKINITLPNYEINTSAGYNYFYIQPVSETPGVNKLSVTLIPEVIGIIAD